jgi:glycosyltransferase involved in cell wall biosynthesis
MELSSKPKISLVIPMYNEQKNIKKVIRSIQNQNLQDIEIVCVNDNSNDKSLEILEELQKEDPRITILTNRQNRGVIYNRIYGAIRSKGEYVTFIDADDALCNINILEKAYRVATKEHNEKIDIVHYQTCGCLVDENGKMDKFAIFFTFNPNTFNQVIRAPYIGDNYFQNKKDVTGSGFVFDKIYSRELIIRAANYIGPDVWNQNLVYIDDLLLCFAAMKNAKTIVSLNEIGYWHFFDKKTSVTSGVWEIEGNRLKYPAKTNKKIGDFFTIVERILKLTENEPQSGEIREFVLKQIGSDEYMPTIARSVHYEKYIFLTEQAYKWKYNDKSAKARLKKFFNYLLSFEIKEKDKFAYLFEKNTKKKS